MARFPARTLVLMVLALCAFVFMWWRTHQLAAMRPKAEPMMQLELVVTDGGISEVK